MDKLKGISKLLGVKLKIWAIYTVGDRVGFYFSLFWHTALTFIEAGDAPA